MSRAERDEIYRAKLNMETAQIAWRELQRYFASGVVIAVSPELDLVEVAFRVSEDDAQQVSQWMDAGGVARVTDEQAKAWYEEDAMVWAVVARPYVLVQSVDGPR
ncbi:MAG: DUF2288 domain-containing protein [Nitrosomonadales bacterium]|nr:DUF2288 domain-containing protein [Nitrosomonadales bacterium]MBK9162136.1 DUF2288 domain-containing protein [Nitrosomonadales bacterium]